MCNCLRNYIFTGVLKNKCPWISNGKKTQPVFMKFLLDLLPDFHSMLACEQALIYIADRMLSPIIYSQQSQGLKAKDVEINDLTLSSNISKPNGREPYKLQSQYSGSMLWEEYDSEWHGRTKNKHWLQPDSRNASLTRCHKNQVWKGAGVHG